ncbi:MAG: hypothetical protein IT306_16985 [Chloroflexi bacterium]|nr:hypothetical protein [Chloroflexota bacterium]
MPNRDSRHPRAWMRDPFLFALALMSLAFITVVLAIAGRLFNDPALIGLAVVSTCPAFWLFYQRQRVVEGRHTPDHYRRP